MTAGTERLGGAIWLSTGAGTLGAGVLGGIMPGKTEPAGAPVTAPGASTVALGHGVPSGRIVIAGRGMPGGVVTSLVEVVMVAPLRVVVVVAVIST